MVITLRKKLDINKNIAHCEEKIISNAEHVY